MTVREIFSIPFGHSSGHANDDIERHGRHLP